MKAIHGKNKCGGVSARITRAIVLFLFLTPGAFVSADNHADLESRITRLSAQMTAIQTALSQLATDQAKIISKLGILNVGQCGIMVAGNVTGTAGASIQVPITFISGPTPIAALQTNFSLPPGFSVTAAIPGPAANAASKTIVLSTSTATMLVFGFNQTVIPTGVVATATIKGPATSKGFFSVDLSLISASDPNGNTVPLCGMSGGIKQ